MNNSPTGPAGLTGVWRGLYTYADGGSVSFVATLIEAAKLVHGGTHEAGAARSGAGQTLFATLSGERRGSRLAFTKIYDGSGGWAHAVWYEGAVSGDECEIEGRWRISSMIAGRFMMVREPGKVVDVARRVEERA